MSYYKQWFKLHAFQWQLKATVQMPLNWWHVHGSFILTGTIHRIRFFIKYCIYLLTCLASIFIPSFNIFICTACLWTEIKKKKHTSLTVTYMDVITIFKTIPHQQCIPESVKDWISYVRSTLRFSVLAKTKPMNHIVQNLSGSGSSCEKHSGFTCASVMCTFLSKFPIRWRTLDSTKPTHSNWSSADDELASRTIKCLKE